MSTTAEFLTKEDYLRMEKSKNGNAWYNPVDEIIYTGEESGNQGPQPTWEEPVFNVGKFRDAKKMMDAGNKSHDEITFAPWLGHWKDIANEAMARYKSAGVMTTADYATINSVTVLNELLGTTIRPFTIPDALRTVSTPTLELQVDAYTRFTISQDVPEGVAAQAKLGTIAVVQFNLTKDVAHVAATDEVQLKARKDVYRTGIENATTDFRRSKSDKIADVVELATAVAGADWAAYSTDHSTTSPYDNIGTVKDTITANNGMPSIIISSDKAFRDFVGNTHVKGMANAALATNNASAYVMTNIPGLPGYTWYIDDSVLNTSIIVMDPNAVMLAQGPTRVGQYRLEIEGIDGYVAREWYQAQIVQAGKIREITGVTA